MSKSIWKFPLYSHVVSVMMPVGAKILCVDVQEDQPQLWALVTQGSNTENREIRIYGTGFALPEEPSTYIGTYQQMGGQLVWHVFEVGHKEER